MIHINEAVIVEGKYDKIKLTSLIDAVIIETGGFSIFTDSEKLDLIRKLAEKRGVLIITDSDRAGFLIRSYLGGALPKDQVKHAYIPDVFGKESRKGKPSKEGKLGVEGIEAETLMQSLKNAGVIFETQREQSRRITKTDFFEDGLTGGTGSSEKRKKLQKKLGLPERLAANSLLAVLNGMFTYEEYKKTIGEI